MKRVYTSHRHSIDLAPPYKPYIGDRLAHHFTPKGTLYWEDADLD